MSGALEGVRVIEMAGWNAVPSAAAILSDWGADVIKVESFAGDPTRGLKSLQNVALGEVNVLFECLNRNKRGVALDMGCEGAAEVLGRLVKTADVFMTSFRPVARDKIGIAFDQLKTLNPRLVYASLTGFGTKGPDKDKPGFDYSGYWAKSGFLSKYAEGMPYPPYMRPGMGDSTTSMLIAGAISAALFARERSGLGQEVDLSLYHTGIWVLNNDIQIRLALGEEVGAYPRTQTPNPLWNTYLTKDGRWIQLVMLQADRFWPAVCKALHLDELEHDPRYATMDARQRNCESLIAVMDEVIAQKTATEWDEIMAAHDLYYAKAATISDVVQDPQAWENGYFVKVPHPSLGELTTVASPVTFRGTPATVRTSAPEVGQHTDELLLELGYEWDEVVALRNRGVIL